MKHPDMMSRLSAALSRAATWIDDLLFPEGALCLVCQRAPEGEMQDGLCEACARALEAQRSRQEALERMLTRPVPEELAYVHAAFPYEEPAKRLITTLKYSRVRSAAVPLIQAMTMLESGEEDLIVPVPTTQRRLRERGFNQAALLAQGIAKELGMECMDALERVGEQKQQAKLSGEERLQNLRGCMRAKGRLDGRRIVLVDDVYTTGATAAEAARALLAAGAASVGMFAAARSLPEEERPAFLQTGRKNRP